MAAPKGNNFNPNGRPKKPIDWEEFEKLCGMQCTQSEMASWFHMLPATLSDRVEENYKEDYQTIYKRYSENGKASLRRTQYKLAQKSPAMAIFLGKQKNWLGQSDESLDEKDKEDLLKPFMALMAQISALQSDRKMAESNSNNEVKSA